MFFCYLGFYALMRCEIILVGNELLIGKIQDTNGQWIIHKLIPLGVEVSRITIIKDELKAISSTIRETLARKPDYIFTSGGLGPTYDDMTLEGIAKGFRPQVKLIQNQDAYNMVLERYQKIYPGVQIDKLMKLSRVKMTILPEGAIPLKNSEGSAPGVLFPPKLTNRF